MSEQNKSPNAVWQEVSVTRANREKLHGHRSLLVWFTGLSGSGKSTLVHATEQALHARGRRTYALDGDNVRHGLCADLGFSDNDRTENIRRIGEVANLFVDSGAIVLAAFISPFRADRQKARNLVDPGDFIEVFCDCSLEICEQRDVKGLYKKARRGEIKDFTGISSPYEAPIDPEVSLNTGELSVAECVERIMAVVEARTQLTGD
ncbi:adenylyl-sulfate kinase [Magnetofaba australis]|uniref:Adenylyl-sulfate kinase n=1 Tax=Magnetofaba australis IT-1 TaxID=1434232 RepID=A0A1Y2K6Q0_9PROT|nr:adenylyl-sulfate kinase [Magnetofaba australis]OSM05223.1 putative adenylylsulfate kinase [Magnetofaba australis IT-1]